MSDMANAQDGVVGIGARALHVTRQALLEDLGEAGEARLQEIGFAAGEEVYNRFCQWLPGATGVSDPADLDSDKLTDVLSEFFGSLGWGPVTVERVGKSGLYVSSDAWAEADPAGGADYPSCYFSTGLFASFLTCLAGGGAVGAMELECRTSGDARCRFLAGSPETLDAVYQAMTEERDFEEVLGA